MDKLKTIIKPVEKEFKIFQKQYSYTLQGHNLYFQYMIDYISGTNGKYIRPLILLLSAKLCGKPNKKTIDYAIILELLHTATLIHDDVVDSTLERRGKPSINAKFDNKTAVLLGDYILSLSIVNAVKTKKFIVLDILSKLAQCLTEGELAQLTSSKNFIIAEESYFEIIRKKTAILLSYCTEMGALSVNADKSTIAILAEIGENLGRCFQIKDDIFDYFEQGEIGKPTGNDIREGKVTLPLIYALKNAPEEISDSIIQIIKKQDFTPENVFTLIDFAKKQGGIEYAQSKMLEIKQNTIALLNQFPDSEAKTAMIDLIDYIIERKR
jgi:octaprenyl-diphosphate synthase